MFVHARRSRLKTPAPFWTDAFSSIRTNFLPGLVLWVVAAAVVLLYYFVPGLKPLYNTISGWKSSGGFFYSMLSTALFAGVLPFVFLRAMPSTRVSATW